MSVVVNPAPAVIAAGASMGFAETVTDTLTLTAMPDDGYVFAGWTVAVAGRCDDGPLTTVCRVVGATADTTITASFQTSGTVFTLLAVEARSGPFSGMVSVAVGNAAAIVGRFFAVVVPEGQASMLTAMPTEPRSSVSGASPIGSMFSRWELSDGLSCAEDLTSLTCTLAVADPLPSTASVEAVFSPRPFASSIYAGANGSVSVMVGADPAVTVDAGASTDVTVVPSAPAASDFTLAAMPGEHYAFADWTLSAGLSCVGGTVHATPCAVSVVASLLPAGSASAAFSAMEYLLLLQSTNGSLDVSRNGVLDGRVIGDGADDTAIAVTVEGTLTLTAIPDAGYVFTNWGAGFFTPPRCVGRATDITCTVDTGAVAGDGTGYIAANFAVVPSALTVSAGANGSVSVMVATAAAVVVNAGASMDFTTSVLDAITLTAAPETGYVVSAWNLPGGLACVAGNACVLPAGSITADGTAMATFALAPVSTTVAAGVGGSVLASIDGGSAVTVSAASSTVVTAEIGNMLALEATPAAGYAFAGWTLSEAACSEGPTASTCTIEIDVGSKTAMASFRPADMPFALLAVAAGANGSATAAVDGVTTTADMVGRSLAVVVPEGQASTLTAMPDDRYMFASWDLNGFSGAFSCPGAVCALPAGTLLGSTSASATANFGPITRMLTVSLNSGDDADSEGAVSAQINGGVATTITETAEVGVTVEDEVTLTASAMGRTRFIRWRTSGGVACAETSGSVCILAAGSVTDAAASATADFISFSWSGPGAVTYDDSSRTVTAAPYVEGAFIAWTGPSGCSSSLTCDLSMHSGSVRANFLPFVGDDVGKSLVFGLGYDTTLYPAAERLFYQVSFQERSDAGFSRVDSLGRALLTSSALVTLELPSLLISWQGGYMTESCITNNHASDDCVDNLMGGAFHARREALEDAVGEIAISTFLRPAGFASAIALSGDAAVLVAGNPRDHRPVSVSGIFPSTAPGFADLTTPNDAFPTTGQLLESGAVYVYRAPDGTAAASALEAYIRSPNPGASDQFGSSVTLSGDGSTLVVGAGVSLLNQQGGEASSAIGIFVPGGAGYAAALADNGVPDAGAAYVYRRSSGVWGLEAYVKAPNTGLNDQFGSAVALSGDGDTLAVGASGEDSAATGAFASSDSGYTDALADNDAADAGAAYVYRRSSGAWDLEAYVKAPNTGAGEDFGSALALSGAGDALAVGAPSEDSAATGVFVPGGEGYDDALLDTRAAAAGAAYVYRRSTTGQWSVEAYVKAPNSGGDDGFGSALALSGSGTTLAVGALNESGSDTGIFVPGGEGYDAALGSDAATKAGAAYVYRRSSGAWGLEAYVKAPNTDAADEFGSALALSADGDALAVGATEEDGGATGVFVPDDGDYTGALGSDTANRAGAAYVYSRSGGSWAIKAYVKELSSMGNNRQFGRNLALSADGARLAAGRGGGNVDGRVYLY